MKDLSKKTKIIIIGILSITVLLVIGATYAYFTAATVGGNASANSIQLLTSAHGNITVNYLNGNGLINMNNVDLKENEKGTTQKGMVKFSVNYPGSEEEKITIMWKEVTNTFCQYQTGNVCTNISTDTYVGDEIYFKLYECDNQSALEGATTTTQTNCSEITRSDNNTVPITNEEKRLQNDFTISLTNTTKYYLMILNIDNITALQDYNQGRTFRGRIEVMINDEFLLNFDLDGGEIARSLTENIKQGLTTDVPIPTKDDYNFVRWNISELSSSLNGTIFTMGTDHTTLTAVWELIPKCELTIANNILKINLNNDAPLAAEAYSFTGNSTGFSSTNTTTATDKTAYQGWIKSQEGFVSTCKLSCGSWATTETTKTTCNPVLNKNNKTECLSSCTYTILVTADIP